MKKITCYLLEHLSQQDVEVPRFAQLLSICVVSELPVLYALIDPAWERVLVKRRLITVSVGEFVPEPLAGRELCYVGSYPSPSSSSVIEHVFEHATVSHG